MELYRLRKKDIDRAAEVLGRAYLDYPSLAYLVPDEKKLKKYIKYMYKIELKLRFRHGEIYGTSPDLEGVIAWIFSDNYNISLFEQLRTGGLSLIFKIGIGAIKRFLSIESFFTSIHMQHMKIPHWLLGPFGVDPLNQGKGRGSFLLRSLFKDTDSSEHPIYLYTSTEKNFLIYQHMGFQLIEKANYPDGNIPFWFMIRYP